MNTIRLWPALALATSLLAACGGGDDSMPADAGPVLGDPVTQTVGTAGGTVVATTLGVNVSVTFPKDAFAVDTTVKVTPQQPAAGESVRLKLEPGGVFFARPATIVLSYPAGKVPNVRATLKQNLAGSDIYLPTAIDASARTLTTQLTTFGGPTLKAHAAAGDSRRQALRAGRGATAPPPDDSGTLAVADIGDTAALIASTQGLIFMMKATPSFEATLQLQLELATLIMRRGLDGGQVESVLDDAHVTACKGRADAIATAQAATLATASDFKPLAANIMYWESLVQRLGGADCGGIASIDAVHELLARELTLVQNGFDHAGAPATFEGPAAGVGDARALKQEMQAIAGTDGATPPVLALDSYVGALQADLLDPALVPARNAAWNTAKETGALGQYVPLLTAFGATAVLQQDLQYVLTSATIRSADDSNYALDTRRIGIGNIPDLPADPVRAADVGMRGGTLEISGSIGVLQCPAPDSEKLTVTFDGVDVASVASSNDKILDPALPLAKFTAAGLLAAKGLPANDTGKHTLLLRRTASACAAQLGLTDDVLATVTLDFGAPEPPLKKFENCYYVQGNVLPVDPSRADTYEIARQGNGTSYLYLRNLAADFHLDNVIYPAVRWPSESAVLTNVPGEYFGQPLVWNMAFSVDAQGKRRLKGTAIYTDGSVLLSIDATCHRDLP